MDQPATERLQRAAQALDRAADAASKAQSELEAASEEPPLGPGQGGLPEVEKSDADKAPTFEPPGGDQKVDDVM